MKENKDDDVVDVPAEEMPNEPYRRYEGVAVAEEEKLNPVNLDVSKAN
jgi:hypothetical protein